MDTQKSIGNAITEEEYDAFAVELVRNNGITVSANEMPDCDNYFFMFDYFDILYFKELKGDCKDYLNYFVIGDPFNNNVDYKVSYKTLSLYQRKQPNDINPFVRVDGEICSDTGLMYLSDIPFLGVIQISLCKESYQNCNLSSLNTEEFLKDCEVKIEGVVEEHLKKISDIKTVRKLYRCSTTGDFCLVMRTDSINVIYQLAFMLDNMREENFTLFTYTSVGMECSLNKEKKEYCTLSQRFINNHGDVRFSLRFIGDCGLGKALKAVNTQDGIKGLFGRYDYMSNVDIQTFAELYPQLCRRKIGILGGQDHKEILDNEGLWGVNERVIVDAADILADISIGTKPEESEKLEESYAQKIKSEVKEKNIKLYNEIKELEKYDYLFQQEYRAFQELFRCMIEVYKNFSAAGMEKDAYTNWCIYLKDIDVLCKNVTHKIEYYLEKIQSTSVSEEEKRKIRVNILKNWRVCLQAVNQYTKLVQNVNYQTYQAPVYELQTQIDTEKTMVAYREMIENYMRQMKEYFAQEEPEDPRDTIRALLYPELVEEKVRLYAPFSLDDEFKETVRHIICRVPSFEYFGRLYDVLPWLLHECSHQIRVMPREKRNEFVVEDIFSYIFNMFVLNAFKRENSEYVVMDCWGKRLSFCFARTAIKELKTNENFRNWGFDQLDKEINGYLDKIIQENSSIHKIDRAKKIIRELHNQYRLLSQYGTEEQKKSFLEYTKESMDNYESDSITVDRLLDLVREMVKLLLEWYKFELKNRLFIKTDDDSIDAMIVELKDIFDRLNLVEAKNTELMKYIQDTMGKSGNKLQAESAVRRYFYAVKKLYRMYYEYTDIVKSGNVDNIRKQFLESVFDKYTESGEMSDILPANFLLDTDTALIFRNLGLLNPDKEMFCEMVGKWLNALDRKEIFNLKEYREKLYRESWADLLMAISLQLSPFGYCRLILQTISDARTNPTDYMLDDINCERIRIVSAVLLGGDGVEEAGKADKIGNVYEFSCPDILKKGKQYCVYMLQCILERIEKTHKDKPEEMKRVDELFHELACTIEKYFDEEITYQKYDATLMYAIETDSAEKLKKKMLPAWENYQACKEILKEYRHQLWRIEVFCKGMGRVIQGGCIRVSYNMYQHMAEMLEKVRGSYGCIWEEDSMEGLLRVKKKVGEFYNDPSQALSLSTQKKLENTIEFIQEYYYHNRARLTKKQD